MFLATPYKKVEAIKIILYINISVLSPLLEGIVQGKDISKNNLPRLVLLGKLTLFTTNFIISDLK